MDYMGVDMAVLQTDHVYGSLNEYLSDCSRRYPGRFLPLAQIREWEGDQPVQLERLESAITNLGLRGLYFASEAFAVTGWKLQLDDSKLEPLWALVERMQIPVFWYLWTSQIDRFGGYMDQVDRLTRWAKKHPAIRSVMTHGFETVNFRQGTERFDLPRPILDCIKLPNMHVEIMFHLMAPDMEYPFEWAQRALKELYEEMGPEKLLWGSDMPGAERTIAYHHTMDYVRLHADFMSDSDKAMFFGGNAARVLQVVATAAAT
jgi:predicted TIM-barrel fold metal-dependent hydrolase